MGIVRCSPWQVYLSVAVFSGILLVNSGVYPTSKFIYLFFAAGCSSNAAPSSPLKDTPN